MSSRVLSSAGKTTAAPIAWRRIQNSPPPVPSGTQQSPVPQVDDASARLSAQIAQLQQQHAAETATAYQRGLAEGEARAKAGPAAEMQSAQQQMLQSVRELAQMRTRLRREAESDVVRLALAIAQRVLRRELSVDPHALEALVHVALQRLDRQEVSRVFVHPHQAAEIQNTLQAAGVRVEVVAEVTRPSGSLAFQTNHGVFDASINAQLEEIERGLTDRLSQS